MTENLITVQISVPMLATAGIKLIHLFGATKIFIATVQNAITMIAISREIVGQELDMNGAVRNFLRLTTESSVCPNGQCGMQFWEDTSSIMLVIELERLF
mmetsp:Transcript_31093/g.47083  ORF Transcript_31093/g.47083 Transcript_31093/m.47083 type:complete len:100 (-) Transcript_31093:173-472(-)